MCVCVCVCVCRFVLVCVFTDTRHLIAVHAHHCKCKRCCHFVCLCVHVCLCEYLFALHQDLSVDHDVRNNDQVPAIFHFESTPVSVNVVFLLLVLDLLLFFVGIVFMLCLS